MKLNLPITKLIIIFILLSGVTLGGYFAWRYVSYNPESLQFGEVKFLRNDTISITIINTGKPQVTLTEIWVNGAKEWLEEAIIYANCQETFTLNVPWVSGSIYRFIAVTSYNNKFSGSAFAPVLYENLYMSKLHVWYNTTSPGWAEAAFVLVNTGYLDVLIDKITCRSQTSHWSNVYYWRTNTVTITADLNVTSTQLTGSTYTHLIQGATRDLSQATDDLTLKSGWALVIYVDSPDSVGQNDVGIPVEVTVFTASAHWTQEVHVEAAQ